VARLLLSAGANIDAVTDQGRSGLLYACSRNREAVAKMLLDNHANANLQDKLGASPLHRAASCGHVK
jgi:26S proteasome non-ATPase regulatory subunit 10